MTPKRYVRTIRINMRFDVSISEKNLFSLLLVGYGLEYIKKQCFVMNIRLLYCSSNFMLLHLITYNMPFILFV